MTFLKLRSFFSDMLVEKFKITIFLMAGLILLTPRSNLEPHAQLVWCLDKQSARKIYMNSSKAMVEPHVFTRYYIDHEKIVYFNQEGNIDYRINKGKNTLYSLSKKEPVYVKYKAYGKSVTIFHRGEAIRSIRTEAYPFLSGDGKNILMMTGEAEGFFVYTISNGNMKSTFQTGSPVLDMAQGEKNFYLGALEGIIVKVVPETGEFNKKFINTSGINIIKKIAVSKDESMLAYINGSFPEYIILEKKGRISKIRTTENKRNKRELVFSQDGRVLAEETEKGLNLYSTGLFRRTLFFTNSHFFSEKKFFQASIMKKGRYMTTFLKDGICFAILFERKQPLWFQRFDSENIFQDQISESQFLIEDDNHVYYYRFEGL